MTTRKQLGELLVDHGYVSEEQVEQALSVKSASGESRLLGQILIARGFVTAPQIQIVLARQKEQGG